MKKIEVLGTGCYKCIQLETLLTEILQELGQTEVTVGRISDERSIRKFMPVEEVPGLVIDGHLISSGEVPSREKLLGWFSAS
jgi:hypothetical protein